MPQHQPHPATAPPRRRAASPTQTAQHAPAAPAADPAVTVPAASALPRMRVVAYLRVSTDEQRDSGLGMAAQRVVLTAEAARRGWDVTWIEDAGYSAKSLDRPGIQEALHLLNTGKAHALVVAKLDRLSRSLLDFAGVTEQARRRGWAVVALDLGVDMTTPAGEMLANVLAAFAQYERALISQRTTVALAAARARGQRLGRPRATPDAVVARVVALAADHSPARVAAALTAEGVPTTRSAPAWRASTVRRVLAGVALDATAAAARTALNERTA